MEIAVLAVACVTAACGPEARPPPRERPDVLLIVIDTLRADHLGVYGYDADTSPSIDAFARENLRFELAVASAPWTAPSVASIFTGLYPTAHRLSRHAEPKHAGTPTFHFSALSPELETLAEALGRGGYRTAAVVANPWVADYLGFDQGFDTFEVQSDMPAAEVNDRAFRILDALEPQRPPFFLYLHYLDPHTPYAPPSGDPILAGPLTRERYPPSELARLALYDAEIAYVDARIGELFEGLRSRGLYDDTAILLTSDHGEQFMEHRERGHGHHVFNPEVHVPLIVKAGGRRGEVPQAVSLVDVLPTVLEIAGTPPRAPVQGVSLFDRAALSQRGVFSEVTRGRNHKAFTRHDGLKLILGFEKPHGAVVEGEGDVVGLFDSYADPLEQSPLDDRALLARMRSGFYALYTESHLRRSNPGVPAVKLREQEVRDLRALGYLEGSGPEGADRR